MGDFCETKELMVDVQENGIIRNKNGSIIGRLSKDIKFDSELLKDSSNFQEELSSLINYHSLENGSDTPDYILSQFLVYCMRAFDAATNIRSNSIES